VAIQQPLRGNGYANRHERKKSVRELLGFSRCELLLKKLVAEAGDNSENRWKGKSAFEGRCRATATEDMTVDISHSGGWSPYWVHSARRPLNGLLYLRRVIMMMENLVE
jgi:hypothetical protein